MRIDQMIGIRKVVTSSTKLSVQCRLISTVLNVNSCPYGSTEVVLTI